ncbi:hypothetical protein swp_4714 [Shewanella piezotolerans WP3]|uniref:Uncharacterized protein n=1 Tax=Shewanella piezotolerans (strain WP3 / JCM 13877) TaxID=225849 RepID=B8CTV5_SHEPW|nr:hypothetical protein swp_4714 [Shewanella piezotolerans WP3]
MVAVLARLSIPILAVNWLHNLEEQQLLELNYVYDFIKCS